MKTPHHSNSGSTAVCILHSAICIFLLLLAGLTAQANTYDWSGNSSASMSGTPANWGGTEPGASDIARWNAATYTNQPQLNGNMTIGQLLFTGNNTGTVSFTLFGPSALTLNGLSGTGIQMDSGSGAVNTGAVTFKIGGNQTWTNNSSSLLTIGDGGITANILNSGTTTPYTLTFGGSGNTTINAVIQDGGGTGTLSLTKTGAGKLTLGTLSSTYTGNTTISSGTLSMALNRIANSGTISIGDNATLEGTGQIILTAGQNVVGTGANGNINVAGNGLTLSGNNTLSTSGTLTFNNARLEVNGTGNAMTGGNLTGSGSQISLLVGRNAGTNVFTISGGTFTSRAGSTDLIGFSGTTVGTLNINGGSYVNTSGSLSFGNGGGGNGGNLTLTSGSATIGTLIYNTTSGTGAVNLDGGTLTLGAITSTAGTSRQINFNGGQFVASGNLTMDNTLTLNVKDGGAKIDTNGKNVTISGSLVTSGSGGLTKNGTGTLTLNAISTYTGGTTVNGGNLTLGTGGANGVIRGALTINSGATVNADSGNWSLGYGGSGGSVGGLPGNSVTSITINGGTLNMTNFNATAGTSATNITMTGGSITGVQLGWIGTNTGNATLQTLASSTTATISSGIGLRLTPSGSLTFDVASGSTSNGVDLLVSGAIANTASGSGSDGGRIVKTGAGTMVLSSNNTYTGNTTISGGTMQFAKTASLYNGTVSNWTAANIKVASGATLALNVGGTNEFSTGNVTTLLTNLGGANGTSTTGFAAGSKIAFDTTNAAAGNFTVADNIANSTGSGGGAIGVTKVGTGTLTLTGNNTYSGVTSIQTGILSFATGNASASATQSLGTNSTVNIGVGGTSSGTLLYTGGAGVLAKNINALGNGQNTVQNSGSGLLTLTGGLSKNGTILVLKGGSNGIAVNGTISGSSANSDLYIDGGTTTLNAANTYNGPTLVYNGGNLTLGINNAIPTASAVTLGNATTSGTLNMGSFTNSIASLSFGAGNGTLKMAANQTGSAQLAASGAVALGTGNTLDLTGMGTSAGVYKLVSSNSSLTGTFSTTTGLDSAYLLRYGTLTANELDAQHKATIGTITGTPAAVSIITGGSTAVTANVANSAPSGSTSLAFTATAGTNMSGSATGNATAGASANSGSGLSFTGTTVGASQNGTFNVTAAETTNSGQTGTVTVNVYDHASGSVGNSTLALGNIHAGYASPVTSTSVSATNASGYRVDLTGSTAAIGNLSLNTLAATAAGSSNSITATLATGQTAGAINQAFTYTFADSSSLSGASSNVGNVTLTVTGGVYNLASANTITTPVLLKTRVGGNFTSSALTITNTADAGSFTEHLDASGSASGNATTSGSISGLIGGSTNNSTLLVGMTADTSTSGNKTGGTVTVALTSNGTGTSGLGNTVINPQDILVSGVVYDYADPLYSKTGGSGTFTPVNSTTYTLNFGTGLALNTTYTANINLANGGSINLFQDALGGAYSYSGDGAFANTASDFSGLASGSSNTFNISFNTGSLGTFTGTLTFAGLSQQSGLSDAALGDFTINILGATTAVPEPSAWAAMFVGVSTFLLLRRRRGRQI